KLRCLDNKAANSSCDAGVSAKTYVWAVLLTLFPAVGGIYSLLGLSLPVLGSAALPNRSICAPDDDWAVNTLNSSPKTRLPSVRNSSSANKGSNTLLSGWPRRSRRSEERRVGRECGSRWPHDT